MISETLNRMKQKLAVYNSYLLIDNRHTVVYNAISGKFLIIKDKQIKSSSDLNNEKDLFNEYILPKMIEGDLSFHKMRMK